MDNQNSKEIKNGQDSYFKKAGWFLWVIPAVLIALLVIFIPAIRSKIIKSGAGKPVFVVSQGYGKIENIFVKKGDFIEPGKELCSFMAACADGSVPVSNTDEIAVDVTVKAVEGRQFDDMVELPGVIGAYTETNLSAQVSGTILEFLVKEGDLVKKGDLIVKIDKRDYQIALNRAGAEFEFSKNEFNRSEQLLKSNAVNLSNHESKKNECLIKQSAYDNAKLAFERCEITAPFDGIVDKKFSEAGEIASPGMRLAKIIDISKVKVNVGIPEKDIAHVRKLTNIKFSVPSLNNKEFSGEFKNIIISMVDVAKVYPLIIEADNPSRELLPGMIVKSKIVRSSYQNAVLLPIFSVIPGDDEYYTYVINSGRAEKRVLKIGSFQDKNVHIISGLNPGDMLIDRGNKLVTHGCRVKVVN